MQIDSIKTAIFSCNDNLSQFIYSYIRDSIQPHDIIVVTSKIISLSEGRLKDKKLTDKTTLIKEESDHYLGEIGYGCHLTIKHNLLIPSAGIDESNSAEDRYILYPVDPFASASKLHQQLSELTGIQSFGVLVTDSHTLPLRKGVIGTALAYWGFRGIRSLVGQEDLFGRKLVMTQINIADALAAAATVLMGEGPESRPLAFIRGAPVEFVDEIRPEELWMDPTLDLYAPLYKHLLVPASEE